MESSERLDNRDNRIQSAQEYADSVRDWIVQYNQWHQAAMFNMTFPYYMMGCMSAQSMTQQSSVRPTPYQHLNNHQQLLQRPEVRRPMAQAQTRSAQNAQREYKIAPIWKRFFAEFIDFFLLFVLKLGVTIVVVEYMGLIDLDQYEIDLDKLFNQDLEMNYTLAFNMTSELVALEVLNRVFITLFEATCLRKGVAGSVGGATPGKRFMGIYVVSSEELVIDLGDGRVQITPAGNIGFWNALVRSVIKNFSLAFFFPVCLTALFFQHHRAAYDVIANCVVVEPNRIRR